MMVLLGDKAAILVIDMQRDFLARGGYADAAGLDINILREPIPNIQALLKEARVSGTLIIFTREGHRQDLSDCPATKMKRSIAVGSPLGAPGPMGRLMVRGEYGHDMVDELQPISGELVLDKPMYDAFFQTDLDLILRTRGIQQVLITGVTTEVCVTSTLRGAVERGYECFTIGDACAAADRELHKAALLMAAVEGGIFGSVINTEEALSALRKLNQTA